MKRLVLLVSLVLVFVMAVPAAAGPFSDVPESHWAYDAIQKVSETGIIGGYPDGTFKGKKTVSRYEMAVVITRILNQVAEERGELAEKVDALEGGLTAGQAEDTIAIFKSLIRKHKVDQPTVKPSDGLTEKEAEEVAGIVEALVMEFKFELEDLGADISVLGDRVTDLEGRMDTLEADQDNFTWNGEYNVDVVRTNIEGNGTPYNNPFVMTDDDGDNVAFSADENEQGDISHSLKLGFDVATNNLEASFDVATSSSDFVNPTNAPAFKVEDIFATVSNEDFTATIGNDQMLNMAPYLFGDVEAESYDGVIVESDSDKYVLIRDWAYYTNADGDYTDADGDVLADDEDPILNTESIKNVVAAQKALGIMDSTLYVGLEDVVENNNLVAGLNTPINVIGADIKTDLAVEKNGEDYYTYFNVDATKEMGMVKVTGNYTMNKDDEFTGLMDPSLNVDGFKARADLTLNENMTANARIIDKTAAETGFGANAALGNLELFADYEDVTRDVDGNEATDASRTQFTADYTTAVSLLDIEAGYAYDKQENLVYEDADGEEIAESNRVTGKVIADLPANLTATGDYVYSVSELDSAVELADDAGLTTHKYAVDYGQEGDMLTAGLVYDMIDDANNVHADLAYSILTAGVQKNFGSSETLTANATVDPNAYEVATVSIDPLASFAMENDTDTNYDYKVAVDATKDVNEKTDLTYGFLYHDRGIASTDDNALEGTHKKHTVGLDYAVTSDVTGTVSYTNLDFVDASDDTNDYNAQEFTAGVGLEF